MPWRAGGIADQHRLELGDVLFALMGVVSRIAVKILRRKSIHRLEFRARGGVRRRAHAADSDRTDQESTECKQ